MGRAARRGATMALIKKSKYKYWVGELIHGHEIIDGRPLDKDNCPIGPAPPLIYPPPMMGNSMPVSSKNFWGMLTNDIKVVEWYVAERKAHGVAVYYDEERIDDDESGDGEYYCYAREDENGESALIYHDGEFIACLYDRADTQIAHAELAYRDKYRAECSAKLEADSAARAIEDAEIKERCKASGCVRKWGEPCKHTLKFSLCPEYLRYHENRESDPWN
jgi:hypothetical protein